jgi:hypothetical protein
MDDELGGLAEKPNLNIRVKNTDTLDEYKGLVYLKSSFTGKLHKWISKHKYQCVPLNNNSELELRVEIFKFVLKRVPKSDVEQLKQDICLMRKENNKLKGELKLFRYYFLNLWRDNKCRFTL